MEFYTYSINSFTKVDFYDFGDGSAIFRIDCYHHNTHILRANIGTTTNDNYVEFTCDKGIGKFTRSDFTAMNSAITLALKVGEFNDRVKAVKEIFKYLNYGEFDKWVTEYKASNGFELGVSVCNVTHINRGKPTGKYLAIDDLM